MRSLSRLVAVFLALTVACNRTPSPPEKAPAIQLPEQKAADAIRLLHKGKGAADEFITCQQVTYLMRAVKAGLLSDEQLDFKLRVVYAERQGLSFGCQSRER